MPWTKLGEKIRRRLWGTEKRSWEISNSHARRYAQLLRRASVIGLPRAREEYTVTETLRGRSSDEILTDLDLFETLDLSAEHRGWNPVSLQRSRDATAWVVTPISIATGVSVLLRLAHHDSIGVAVAMAAAVAATFMVRHLGSVVCLFLARGT